MTATISRAAAEIMILAPQSKSLINDSGSLPRRVRPSLYLHPEVLTVEEMSGSGSMLINHPAPGEERKESQVQIWGIDPIAGSPTLPTDFSEATRLALLEPMTVAIDETARKALGVELGDRATINGRAVRVAALLEGYPSVMETTVVMSRQTQRALGMGNRGVRSGPLMVRIRNPGRAELVRDQLNATSNGTYRAWLRDDLAKANERAMLEEQIIGIMLAFSVVLGVLIGVGITSQTLRGAILASIKEFASLRALGVSMGSLRLIVLELSWWVGLAGLAATGVLVALVTLLAAKMGLPMAYPLPMVLQTVALLMFIALLSGFMALGMLKKSQPADLLR